MKSMMPRTKLLKDFVKIAKTDVSDSNLPCPPNDERGHSFAKQDFHRLGKRVLKVVAEEMGLQSGSYDIRSNLGGQAVSGEVTLHGENIYIQFSQSCAGLGDSFMYRKCEGRKDYTGLANHWMEWDYLLDIPSVCQSFKQVAMRGYL